MSKVEAFGWQLDIDLPPTKTHLAYKDSNRTLCGCEIPKHPLSISRYTGIEDCKRGELFMKKIKNMKDEELLNELAGAVESRDWSYREDLEDECCNRMLYEAAEETIRIVKREM